MKLIRERLYDSDVTVMISENDEYPLLVATNGRELKTVNQVENQWMIDNNFERVAAINGGFFIMSNGEKLGTCMVDWGYPVNGDTGWQDGICDIAYDGSNLHIGDLSSSNGYQWARAMSYGIIKDGKKYDLGLNKYSHATSRQPRTMLGQTNDGKFISIVVDGRGVKSKIDSSKTSLGVTYEQQYQLGLKYNCKTLINCDGGGSSVAEYDGEIINNPCDGSLRRCSDFIVFYRKKKQTPVEDNKGDVNVKKLVLDAGHGYNTAGKRTPDGVREWYMNSKVCEFVQEKLKAYDGIEVYRIDDTTGATDISLSERVKRSNNINPDLTISVHHNAGGGTGTEVYWHNVGTAQDKYFAHILAPKLAAHTGLRNRGVKQAAFTMLTCKSTVVLAEGGFMDTQSDIDVITSWGMEAYADAIVESVVEYFKLEKKVIEQPKEEVQVNENGETLYYRVVTSSHTIKSEAVKKQEELKSKGIDSFLAATWIKK